MKQKFSTKWTGSKRPSKQRKYTANAPLHLRKKFVSVHLSKDLRKKIGKRNVPVKKDDKIKVLRGKFKGKEGKILKVNLKQSRVIVEGLQVSKMDGSKANVKMQPSNLQIIEMAERKTKKQENKTETTKNKESKTKLEEKKE